MHMKFITYFLLAMLGIVIGVAGYAVLSPLLPDSSDGGANQDQTFGGKSKEQIAAEFLAGLEDSNNGEVSASQKTILGGLLEFDGGDYEVAESESEDGLTTVSFVEAGNDQPSIELFVQSADNTTYESFIDSAIYDRVVEASCSEFTEDEEGERTCFYAYLDRVSCDGNIGEMQLECYEAISYNETGDRTYLFGQTVDFSYYIVVQDLNDPSVEMVLESFDFYPEN